uniref:Uncharacterized protein n=1 Tax=Vitis vinifera TaxID=29760 RepID=A5AYM9_VITVI|nr:hypothetical protein VITISV_029504 [Vitis vinifera]
MSVWREAGGPRGEADGPRGGRSCFVVEAKSFEILVEEVGGKLKGCIWERCKGISSWIRFGEASLRCLLDGVETCCREPNNRGWAIGWEEGNRKYKLERRLNVAGRFFCTHELQKSGEKPKSSQHWKGHQPANPDHERKGRFSTRQRACIPHQGGKLFCAFFSLPFAYEIFLK